MTPLLKQRLFYNALPELCSKLRPGVNVELGINVLNMRKHRVHGNKALGSNGFIRQSVNQQGKNLLLAAGKVIILQARVLVFTLREIT
jgi:hypothetical protein